MEKESTKTKEGHSVGGTSGSMGSSLTIAGKDSSGRISSLETSSVPSSPSKPSLVLHSPSNQQTGLKLSPPQPLQQSNISNVPGAISSQKGVAPSGRAFTVHPITEEEIITRKISSNEQQPSSSPHHKMPTTGRGGSVGRHPSGGHHSATAVSTPNGSNSNISGAANAPIVRTHNLNRSMSNVEQPKLTTNFMPWSAKYFTKV